MLGDPSELPKDLTTNSGQGSSLVCPRKGMVVMGKHNSIMAFTEKWNHLFGLIVNQLAEGVDDGNWLCHFRNMGTIFSRSIELNLQPQGFDEEVI